MVHVSSGLVSVSSEFTDARGGVGAWMSDFDYEYEPDDYNDDDEWFEIKGRRTLKEFVRQFGKSAADDELHDWSRDDLIELIFKLGGVD